jgi:hypothetical protein
MRRLVGAGRIERPVVGDDPDRLAFDAGVAAHGGGAVLEPNSVKSESSMIRAITWRMSTGRL